MFVEKPDSLLPFRRVTGSKEEVSSVEETRGDTSAGIVDKVSLSAWAKKVLHETSLSQPDLRQERASLLALPKYGAWVKGPVIGSTYKEVKVVETSGLNTDARSTNILMDDAQSYEQTNDTIMRLTREDAIRRVEKLFLLAEAEVARGSLRTVGENFYDSSTHQKSKRVGNTAIFMLKNVERVLQDLKGLHFTGGDVTNDASKQTMRLDQLKEQVDAIFQDQVVQSQSRSGVTYGLIADTASQIMEFTLRGAPLVIRDPSEDQSDIEAIEESERPDSPRSSETGIEGTPVNPFQASRTYSKNVQDIAESSAFEGTLDFLSHHNANFLIDDRPGDGLGVGG